MDPLQSNNDDDLNFDKSGIQLRLNRLIEKQTKRYEALINEGNHGDAQRLLQIIWQLKQLRLPGSEDFTMEQSIPPGKLAPILEPYLKNSLNDSQLSLLFEKQEASSLPPIAPMEPSMPELLKMNAPIVNSTPTEVFLPAPTAFPSIPAPKLTPPQVVAKAAESSISSSLTAAPVPVPTPSHTVTTPAQSPASAPRSTPPDTVQSPATTELEKSAFDDISSGEFDIAVKEHFQPPLQKVLTSQDSHLQSSDFEDESSKYDDPEANSPLRGLTTGHAPVVRKEDLVNYRKEVRDAIAWEEEDEIAPVKTTRKQKNYLREKVQIKSSEATDDSSDEDNADSLYDEIEFAPKNSSKNKLFIAAAAAVLLVACAGGVYVFSTLSAPKFEELEKMGQQSDKSPFEMEQLYAKAAKASPNDARGWSGLSYWQSRQGQNLLALESQAKAIKLAPKDAKQWYALAVLLKTSSNYKQSLRAANEAVALDPQNNQYLSLQEQVQEYNP